MMQVTDGKFTEHYYLGRSAVSCTCGETFRDAPMMAEHLRRTSARAKTSAEYVAEESAHPEPIR